MEQEKSTTLSALYISMDDNEEGLSEFLQSFGFSEDELTVAIEELNAYRSIPGTTIERFMNRAINNIGSQERLAFLKGIIVGVAVGKAADALSELDIFDEEKQIDNEIEKLGLST